MMKKLFFALAVCCGLLTACKPGNEPTQDPTLPTISRDFDATVQWFGVAVKQSHPLIQQAWNADADPAEFNLLLVSEDKSRISQIKPDGTSKEWKKADWSDEIQSQVEQMNSFAFAYVDGRYYTLIWCNFTMLDQMAEVLRAEGRTCTDKDMFFDLLILFYHESFHQFVQNPMKGWEKSSEAYNRDQTYPMEYEPRIYRKLALIALKNAWEDESKKAACYARAKYWTAKYEKNYPQEAAGIKSTDIDEATAEYFARYIVHNAFPESVPLLYDIDTYNLGRDLDVESYMSSVAVQLLHREGRMTEAIGAFKSQMMTPINVLLKDVEVPANYDESQDAQDSIRIRQATEKISGEESPYVQPVAQMVKKHQEGNNIYLGMMEENGAYTSSQGTYSLRDIPGYSCVVNYEVSCSTYELKQQTILVSSGHDLAHIADMSHLVLENEQQAYDPISPIPSVTITKTATLTAVNGEDKVTIKQLPVFVMIGKDKYGNTYVLCDFKYNL